MPDPAGLQAAEHATNVSVWSVIWAAALGLLGIKGGHWYALRRPRDEEEPGAPTVPPGVASRAPPLVCAGMHGAQAERIQETHASVQVIRKMLVDESNEDGVPRSRYRLMHEQLMESFARMIAMQEETQQLTLSLLGRMTTGSVDVATRRRHARRASDGLRADGDADE